MISESWVWNLLLGILLALAATAVLVEAKSSALVPKSLLLWPALVILFGGLSLFLGGRVESLFRGLLGLALILCGVQALLVNVRKLSAWPSGVIWLGVAFAGIAFQFYPLFLERVMGWIWAAIGVTKVIRERSASLEAGTPIWILLLYGQAILLAAYRL